MARDYYINGECLVQVKGRSDSSIASLTQLGLADRPVSISFTHKHMDIDVDTHGGDQGEPPEQQYLLSEVTVSMNLVHVDRAVLEECERLSMGNPTIVGTLPRAGTRMGGGVARFAVGNNYIGLNLTSPVLSRPFRFYFAYLANSPSELPLGVRRSVIACTWRVVPYIVDPWNDGVGAEGSILWDNVSDS